jgi:cyclophilin family peptidyl-prolyl cis-trans isomerase
MLEQLKAGWEQRRTARRERERAISRRFARGLRFESLEGRQMMAVTLGSIYDIQVPGGRSVLVPLTGLDDDGGAISYSFSAEPGVTLQLVSPNSKSLRLQVSGTDENGVAFTGTLIMRLFEDLAPGTTARIEQLVTSNYFNNKPIHRVLDGFVMQGGDPQGATSGQKLEDEFTTSLSFVSRGLLAMANSGRDSADSQFFVTAVTSKDATTPIPLANMPQDLNFRYTIFGQLVSGFETFEKIMKTNVQSNGGQPPETSLPTQPITITSATLIDDTQNAVLRITAPESSVDEEITITVTATNAAQETSTQTFEASVVEDEHVDPPFLGTVTDKTTTQGQAISFQLSATDFSEGGVFYKIGTSTNILGTPANVTVSIDQASRTVTLTPAAGFTGVINLLAGVRASGASELASNYDTEAFTLTVTEDDEPDPTDPTAPAGLAVAASSNTGPFDGNGYVSTATPTLTMTAASGSTVQVKMGSTVIGTATETATGSGTYTIAIPAGRLAVGANSITATATKNGTTSGDSTALSVIYAPNYAAGVYVVPGTVGAAQQLTALWTKRNAAYANEIGFFVADSATGAIGGIAPGAAGYAQAALSSSTRQIVFSQGQSAGATKAITVNGGQFLVFYMIQNNTTANFLAKNADNSIEGNNNRNAPLAFFSVQAANPDAMRHAQIIADQTSGRVQFNWEDLAGLGDSDFNDVAMRVSLTTQTSTPDSTLHAPGSGNDTTTVNGTLIAGNRSTNLGDIGVFFVDSPNGAIGSLTPGSSGYAAAALTTANSRVLFATGQSAGATGSVTVPAGRYLAFYTISSGTTANFLSVNSANSSSGSAVAMFSFDAANANSTNHFRWTSPEGELVAANATRLHIMDEVFGSEADFNALAVDIAFAT